MAYIGQGLIYGRTDKAIVTATGGQTSFSPLTYTVGHVDVFLNGVSLCGVLSIDTCAFGLCTDSSTPNSWHLGRFWSHGWDGSKHHQLYSARHVFDGSRPREWRPFVKTAQISASVIGVGRQLNWGA